MNVSNKAQEKCIGEIKTRLSGMQYVHGRLLPGEKVYLERDSENSHDLNAICVKNLDFEDVGFVERRTCVWLAPLIDRGKVFIDGYIPTQNANQRGDRMHGFSLNLKVFLADKGASIFESQAKPTSDVEALQESMRILYENLEGFQNASVITGLQRRLRHVLQRDVTPETHLILNLFESKADTIRNDQGKNIENKIRSAMTGLQIQEGVYYCNLTVFPIVSSNLTHADYILLKNAIDSKTAIVEEVSQQGQVNELMIHNQNDKPILIPEGEILVGAKQNRVVNISILVAAHITLRIPVSCVERGRWRFTTKDFKSDHYAHPKLRSRKLQSVQECRASSGAAYSDQGAVWEEVSMNLKEHQACSNTESITDAYQKSSERIREYKDRFVLPEAAVGVVVGSGNHIIGMDCFDHSASFHQCWERLSDSYFMDSIHQSDIPVCPQRTAQEFLERIQNSIEICDPSIGLGNELTIKDESCTGVGVWYSDSLCHLSAFSVE